MGFLLMACSIWAAARITCIGPGIRRGLIALCAFPKEDSGPGRKSRQSWSGSPSCLGRDCRSVFPWPRREGGLCTLHRVDGQPCVVTCFQHVPGSRVGAEQLNPGLYKKLGRLLGELHAGAVRFGASAPRWERGHWLESRLICQDLEAMGSLVSERFRSSVAELVNDLRTWPVDSSTYGPVHGDVSFGNCHLHGGELWLYDFDNAEHGYFVQDLATVLYDSVYCKVLNKFADPGLTDRMLPLWQAVWEGYQETGVVKELDEGQLRKFFLLREAVIYIHYHRVLDVKMVSESFKAGLEVMRQNVERQEHQVEFAAVFGGDARLQDARRKTQDARPETVVGRTSQAGLEFRPRFAGRSGGSDPTRDCEITRGVDDRDGPTAPR